MTGDGSPLPDTGGMRLAPRRPAAKSVLLVPSTFFLPFLSAVRPYSASLTMEKGPRLPPPRALLFQVQALRWLGSMPTETVPGPSGDLSRNSTAGDVSNWSHRLLPSLAPGSFISSRGSHRLVSSCRCARAFRCLRRAFYNLSMLAMRGEIRVNRLQVNARNTVRETLDPARHSPIGPLLLTCNTGCAYSWPWSASSPSGPPR